MATNERSIELAGVNLAGQNHVCAFFNTMDEEHRVLGSFYKAGFDAARVFEQVADWRSAIGVYEKMAKVAGPRAEAARSEANKIRLQKFIWE